jgi:hypothetical protein
MIKSFNANYFYINFKIQSHTTTISTTKTEVTHDPIEMNQDIDVIQNFRKSLALIETKLHKIVKQGQV